MQTDKRCDSFDSLGVDSDEGFDRSLVEFPLLPTEKTKQFHDMVHGHIRLPVICFHFMNTSQFQRLKNLKQLGLCYYVYPSASNNRFEHCVGTSYLAGEYAKRLCENQPELYITEKDIKCVYLAGLLHDLGHGPFSHTWEKFMLQKMGETGYSHEIMSLKMLDYLIEDEENKKIKEHMDIEGITKEDIIFIKEMILGHPLPGNDDFKGRKPCKHFLYQIVANDTTKIDVDKFDYLLRDCQQLGVEIVCNSIQRLMDNSLVVGLKDGAPCDIIEETTPTVIVYRRKIESTLTEVFHSRATMHQKVYQHRVTRVMEEMLYDALTAAEPLFKVEGADGKSYSLSTAWKDITAYVKLTDFVFEMIRQMDYGGPQAARILNNIIQRKLYKCFGCFEGNVDEEILKELQQVDSKVRFIVNKINYGGGGKNNPLNKVLFYEKYRPNKLFTRKRQEEPEEKKTFIIYCSNDHEVSGSDVETEAAPSIQLDRRIQAANEEVMRWAEKHNIELHHE